MLPASAGMIPGSGTQLEATCSAPRIRGDDSSVVVFDCAPCIFRDAPCNPSFQANPKETSWTGSIHSVGSRWRSASAASPSSSGSRSRQGSSDWPLAVSALQRDAANDLQVPQHDAGGSTPGRGLVRASHYRLPAPDVYVGRARGWNESTIDDWNAARLGRRVGGGRPRKNALRIRGNDSVSNVFSAVEI